MLTRTYEQPIKTYVVLPLWLTPLINAQTETAITQSFLIRFWRFLDQCQDHKLILTQFVCEMYDYDSFQSIKTKSEQSLWCWSLSLLSKICPFSPEKHWNPSLSYPLSSHSTAWALAPWRLKYSISYVLVSPYCKYTARADISTIPHSLAICALQIMIWHNWKRLHNQIFANSR